MPRARVAIEIESTEQQEGGNGRETNHQAESPSALRRKGYKADSLRYLELQGHQHREADWAWRLPHALEFLLREG